MNDLDWSGIDVYVDISGAECCAACLIMACLFAIVSVVGLTF